jgi:hypothetical protein
MLDAHAGICAGAGRVLKAKARPTAPGAYPMVEPILRTVTACLLDAQECLSSVGLHCCLSLT